LSSLREKDFLSANLPLFLQCQYKVNIKHPRPVHAERRLMDAVTQPVYSKQVIGSLPICLVMDSKSVDVYAKEPSQNQKAMYEAFLVREVKTILESNEMIIAFQPEALDARKRTQICNKLSASRFSALFYPPDILRKAMCLSKWQNLAVILQSHTIIVASKSARVFDLLSTTKKIPELTLLGGFVNGVLSTREGLLRYSRLPSIQDLRSELVSLLSSPIHSSGNLVQLMQLSLLHNLDNHCKQSSCGE